MSGKEPIRKTASSADTAQKTILLVDDEGLANTLISSYLTSQGYHVVAAENAIAALRLVDAHHPDLAIVDILMPGMDGLAFARAARARLPSLKIIFCSGDPEALRRARDSVADVSALVQKPIWLAQLAQYIFSALAPPPPATPPSARAPKD